MKKLSLYIHIPFCAGKKCEYCNFISFKSDFSAQRVYVKNLLTEIKLRANQVAKDYEVSTIFIGGGTPSVLSAKHIKNLLGQIRKSFRLEKDVEITLEANPDSVTAEKLSAYLSFGINRISFGAQTLNNKILKTIGRRHNKRQVKTALSLAKKAGFTNINVDMMIALPHQKVMDATKMAKFLVRKRVPHISCYSLILEENTPLFEKVKKGELPLPSEEKAVKMYNAVAKILFSKKYLRYEVSNFSLPTFACRHNQTYWESGDYLGLGVSAHSFLNGTRFSNTEDLKEYNQKLALCSLPVLFSEKLSLMQQKEEEIMLRLRTDKGIDLTVFNEKFSCDLIHDKQKEVDFLLKNKLIILQKNVLKVNQDSFYLLNLIIAKLI